MARPTTTTRSAGALPSTAVVGLREDLSDQIYNVDPQGFNFLERAGRGERPSSIMYEWELDHDETVNTGGDGSNRQDYQHAVAEGHDPEFYVEAQPIRVANICQINEESLKQTETTNAVNMAGRSDEFARRMEKKIRNLKRKMEYSCWRNGYAVESRAGWATRNPNPLPTDNNEVIRRFAGIKAFIRTNVNTSLSTSHEVPALGSGVPTATPADADGKKFETLINAGGNARPLTEKIVNDLLDKMFNNVDEGLTFDAYMGTFNKRKFSRFSGIVDIEKDIGADMRATIVGAADVYVDENYTLVGYVSRHIDPQDLALMDWSWVDLCYLREMGGRELPSTGDWRAWFMNVEWSVKVRAEQPLGWIGKLTTS